MPRYFKYLQTARTVKGRTVHGTLAGHKIRMSGATFNVEDRVTFLIIRILLVFGSSYWGIVFERHIIAIEYGTRRSRMRNTFGHAIWTASCAK